VNSHAIAEYFISEVLDQPPPEVADFMLDTSVLGELTADACAAVTGRPDAAGMLRAIDAASLFLVALDEGRSSFRYHHLVRQLLRAELRTRDRNREQGLHQRAAEWFESAGDIRRAARHFLAAQQANHALALLQDRVVTDFLDDPTLPPPLDLSTVPSSLLAEAPDRLLGLAIDLILSGELARSGEYLDLLGHAQPPPFPPGSILAARYTAVRSVHLGVMGQVEGARRHAHEARAIQQRLQQTDKWIDALPIILLRAYTWLEDFQAVDREAVAALATPTLTEPVKLVQVPGAQALAWFDAGHLAKAAEAARAADLQARRLGFERHFFAVDHLRTLAGLALEGGDLDAAEQLTEQALSISERGRPMFEFLTLLDRAAIWSARGQVRDALTTVEAARLALPQGGPELLGRADELEAVLRLSLGDLRSPAELADGLPSARRRLLLARIALAAGDHRSAQDHLLAFGEADLTPRHLLVRHVLLAAAEIQCDGPRLTDLLTSVNDTARQGGFLHTVVTTAPQVTDYLAAYPSRLRQDPFTQRLIGAALEVRAAHLDGSRPGRGLPEPLTAAELRILKLLPTSTYPEMAAALYISHNTVKTHLRSVYQKLGVTSRAEAIERAVDLRLL
jgi:LuxR family transcriptional regulator, maltose regulon positive regulatory protein